MQKNEIKIIYLGCYTIQDLYWKLKNLRALNLQWKTLKLKPRIRRIRNCLVFNKNSFKVTHYLEKSNSRYSLLIHLMTKIL